MLTSLDTKDIDVEAAKKKYCGPGKRIPPSVMEDLDAQIKNAKASDNRKLKKILKKRYLNPFDPKPHLNTV